MRVDSSEFGVASRFAHWAIWRWFQLPTANCQQSNCQLSNRQLSSLQCASARLSCFFQRRAAVSLWSCFCFQLLAIPRALSPRRAVWHRFGTGTAARTRAYFGGGYGGGNRRKAAAAESGAAAARRLPAAILPRPGNRRRRGASFCLRGG